jgi:hypothetical protein
MPLRSPALLSARLPPALSTGLVNRVQAEPTCRRRIHADALHQVLEKLGVELRHVRRAVDEEPLFSPG